MAHSEKLPQHVSFVCPHCQFICGWNAKKQMYDGVQVPTKRKDVIQYAHIDCAEKIT